LLNYAVATLTSAPAFANITSFVWVRLTHGRHKVRSVNRLQIAIALLVGVIAFAPENPVGLWLTVVCAVGARVCIAGVATIRATVWRQNYPRAVRARLTGRIITVVTLVIALVGMLVGMAMELHPASFRVFIPLSVLVSLLGIRSGSKIRVRGHRALLRAERRHDKDERPSFNPLRMARLLIEDKRYGLFMLCQFTIGAGNLMLLAPLVLLATDHFKLGYFQGILVAHVIPIVMMPVFLNLWARLLDAWHITTYRALHSWVFVLMAGLIFASAQLNLVWLLYLGVMARGVAFAGGALAWNLGHNDFARDDNAAMYMAVHVTLTGLRGLVMPFVGVALYEWFERVEPGTGSWVFAVGGSIVVVGALGFYAMHRSIKAGSAAGR
ncbi:MAG: MFS transporter, partial [Phycisphaerales bacterium]|nr:MFS transporter [Phycisphaerales bacterium]